MSFCLSCFLRASKFFGASDPSDSPPSRVTPPDSNKPRICDRAFVPAEVDSRIPLGLRQGFPSTRSGLISGRGAPGKQEHSQKVDCRSRSAAHLQCLRRSIREVRGVRGVRRAGRRRTAVGVGWGQGKRAGKLRYLRKFDTRNRRCSSRQRMSSKVSKPRGRSRLSSL